MSGISPNPIGGILTQIAALNATLAAQAQLPRAAAAASTLGSDQFVRSTPAFALPPTGAFTPGTVGPAVAELQQRLIVLGYLAGRPDGAYANGTPQAVAYFQQEYGRPVTGVFDAGDQAVMLAVLSGQRPRVRAGLMPQMSQPQWPQPQMARPQMPQAQWPQPQMPQMPQAQVPQPQMPQVQVPQAAIQPSPPAGAPREVVVGPGDSLITIARSALGDPTRWSEIFAINRDQLADPNRIVTGMRLKLPAGSQGPSAQPAEQSPVAPANVPVANLPAGGVHSDRWNRDWSAADVDFLARAIAAEARGEISKYLASGDRSYRDSVAGAAYVIARTAADRNTSIEGLIKSQPGFLSAYGQGPGGGNADNYRQFTVSASEVSHYDEMVAIAKEALTGNDPTGINPNHYFDQSIESRPPGWAQGNVERQKIASLIFVGDTQVA